MHDAWTVEAADFELVGEKWRCRCEALGPFADDREAEPSLQFRGSQGKLLQSRAWPCDQQQQGELAPQNGHARVFQVSADEVNLSRDFLDEALSIRANSSHDDKAGAFQNCQSL